MSLFKTKYPNNSREVDGTPQLFNDDVVLLCKTSVGPVEINLLEIFDGYWSTQWRIYIIDEDDNASTNNITINAGAGQTINAAPSSTITVNGGSAMIQIVANDQFLATFSSSIPPLTNGHIIQDEGVDLPNQPKLNFIGGGVVASDNPGNTSTDVNIIGGITKLTNAEMLALIAAETVVPSQLYLITDATYTFGGIVVTGLTTNSISREGRTLHLNADYQLAGDYSGVAGFTSALGVWDVFSVFYALGSVLIYNNLHYKVIGAISTGIDPPSDPGAWELIPLQYVGVDDYTSTNGYIFEIDFALYDVDANQIVRRSDKLNNVVELAAPKSVVTFEHFPWGNTNYTYNKISGTLSNIGELCNQPIICHSNIIDDGSLQVDRPSREFPPTISENMIEPGGILTFTSSGVNQWTGVVSRNIVSGTLSSNDNPGIDFFQNTIRNGSSLTFGTGVAITTDQTLIVQRNYVATGATIIVNAPDTSDSDRPFIENQFNGEGTLTIEGWHGGVFSQNTIDTTLIWQIVALNDNTHQGGLNDTLIDKVVSTFPVVLDFNDVNVYNGGVLDLAPNSLVNEYNYVGRFLCINATGTNVASIINGVLTGTPFSLIPYDFVAAPNVLTVTYTLMATPAPGKIVQSSAFPSQTVFDFYTDAPEEIKLLKQSAIYLQQSYTKWV